MINPNFDDPFERWYYGTYIAGLDPDSPIMLKNSPQQQAKYSRYCTVCKMIMENPNMPILDLRKKIAAKYFVSMRATLDWVMFAQTVIEKYKTEALNKGKK